MSRTSRPKTAPELFDEAVAFAGVVQQNAFLDRACEGAPELRAQVQALLAASRSAEAFFATASPFPAARRPALGDGGASPGEYITQIGRYRLLERIGDGGHGVVYLAEQQEPVKRQVALKIIRLGMDTEKVINRFEAERQALALMEHPYIARVLDAGATDTGRPFFVMERVSGVRITEYCDRRRLTLRQRLELFIKVCHAVQHAHQKGVIHRDLKPSNILVAELDGQPIPKVIDFGIAQAADYRLNEQTADLNQFIGSPSYMSPEHALNGGRQVDTRSDIFSLGVLLCELLTGRLPFDTPDWSKLGPDEIRREIGGREARRPSLLARTLDPETALSVAQARSLSPSRLVGRLRGDLDVIALAALARERDRRYATAAALAADVQAHLNDDAVLAQPPSQLYRIRKFAARNKGPALAASLVVAALVAGLGTSTRLYIREQHALRAQIELRRQTEEARANEAVLRRKAEVGERIARAAVQISYGKIAEADALVADLPLDLVQPSLESSLVFKTLGTWHARSDRWAPAARYLAALVSSITSIDPTDTDGISFQLMPAATVIVESGDTAGYERFREILLNRFGDTSQPNVAEQIIKICLLTPAGPDTLNALRSPFDIVERVTVAAYASHSPSMNAWRSFSLGLMQYRRGDYENALTWINRSLEARDSNNARIATCHLVAAMARRRLGRLAEAAASFHAAEQLITRYDEADEAGRRRLNGFWFDWINNRILLREARSALGLPSSPPPPTP